MPTRNMFNIPKKYNPPGKETPMEYPAFLTLEEMEILRKHGGAGAQTKWGVPSFYMEASESGNRTDSKPSQSGTSNSVSHTTGTSASQSGAHGTSTGSTTNSQGSQSHGTGGTGPGGSGGVRNGTTTNANTNPGSPSRGNSLKDQSRLGQDNSMPGQASGNATNGNNVTAVAKNSELGNVNNPSNVPSPKDQSRLGEDPNAASQVTSQVGNLTVAQKNPVTNLKDGIISTAQAIGMDPKVLGTIIGYETAFSFDPLKVGPTTKWGQHIGLIQFGEPQRKEYGVDISTPEKALASQLGPNGAVANYFKDNGWKPGMSELDAYSIVNAGAPGLHNASDAKAGGAPGTVADKVAGGDWAKAREKATAMLGSPATAAKYAELGDVPTPRSKPTQSLQADTRIAAGTVTSPYNTPAVTRTAAGTITSPYNTPAATRTAAGTITSPYDRLNGPASLAQASGTLTSPYNQPDEVRTASGTMTSPYDQPTNVRTASGTMTSPYNQPTRTASGTYTSPYDQPTNVRTAAGTLTSPYDRLNENLEVASASKGDMLGTNSSSYAPPDASTSPPVGTQTADASTVSFSEFQAWMNNPRNANGNSNAETQHQGRDAAGRTLYQDASMFNSDSGARDYAGRRLGRGRRRRRNRNMLSAGGSNGATV